MKTLSKIIIAVWLITLSGLVYLNHAEIVAGLSAVSQVSFGAANPGANALYEQSLAQPLGTADASMFVTSGADFQGNLLPVNSYQCLSVDTGQPNFEAICGTVTASGTTGLTLSITTRGLSTQTGTTSNPSYIFTHRRGADVRITDFPSLTILTNQINGTQTIPGILTYLSHPCTVGSASTTICDKNYIDGQIVAGSSAGSNTVAGIFMTATGLQAASSTASGIFNLITYLRVLPSSIATDTPNVGSNTSDVLMSDLTGHLKQGWLDLTQPFTLSGAWNFLSSVTEATTTSYVMNVGSLTATSSVTLPLSVTVGGSTLNNWRVYSYATTTTITAIASGNAVATSTLMSVPAGAANASTTIQVRGSWSCIDNSTNPNTGSLNLRDGAGDTLGTLNCTSGGTTGTETGLYEFDVVMSGSVASQITVGNEFLLQKNSTAISALDSTPNVTTSSVNLGNAFSIGLYITSNGSGSTQTKLNSMFVRVN